MRTIVRLTPEAETAVHQAVVGAAWAERGGKGRRARAIALARMPTCTAGESPFAPSIEFWDTADLVGVVAEYAVRVRWSDADVFRLAAQQRADDPVVPYLDGLEVSYERVRPQLSSLLRRRPPLRVLRVCCGADEVLGLLARGSWGGTLRELGVVRNGLERRLVGELCDVLRRAEECCPNLTALDIRGNRLDAESVRSVLDAVRGRARMRRLELGGNHCSEEAGTQLRVLRRLRELDVSGSRLGDEGCGRLAEGLRSLPQLRRLDVSDAGVGVRGVRALAACWRAVQPSLRVLDLWESALGDEGAETLASHLSCFRGGSLEALDVSRCRIGPDGLSAIAEALRHVPRLRVLRFGGNELGARACVRLAASLASHTPRLTELDLWNCSVGRDGANALAASALPALPLLRILNLSDNAVGPEAAAAVILALHHTPLLHTLQLTNNAVGPHAFLLLADRLALLPHLASLHVENNDIGDDGCDALVRAAPHLGALRFLGVAGNAITDRGCAAIRDFLDRLPLLADIAIGGNDISFDALADFAESAYFRKHYLLQEQQQGLE
jgi:Ran GTPase-activating protein (RanGAP) involved in mRNA processing and transport